MSRKYVDYSKVREILVDFLKDLPEPDAGKEKLTFEKDYKHFEEQPALRIACRMVRMLADGISSFNNILNGIQRDVVYKVAMIPGPEPETVRVFPNLPLDKWDDTPDLALCNPYMHGPDVLKTFANTVMEALKDGRKAKAWEGTNRCLTRLKRSEVMPLARALTRYTNLKDGMDLPDSTIRDIADRIIDIRKPMELLYADTPAQFLEMYSSGPDSCMTPHEEKCWNFLCEDHNSHPGAFFAAHPYTRGVYVRKRNSYGVNAVAARCIIYQKEDDNWYHGRIYTTGSDSINAKFRENLKEAGITELSAYFDRSATFTMKGLSISSNAFDSVEDDDHDYENDVGDYACPMPYFDNYGGDIKLSWDAATKLFTVKTGKNILDNNVDRSSTAGYISSSRVIHQECSECHASIFGYRERFSHQETGAVYCSPECVESAGHLLMMRSDYQMVVRTRDSDTVEDCVTPHTYYTNERAARAVGAHTTYCSVLFTDEDPGLSRDGYTIALPDGSHIHASYKAFYDLQKAKLIELHTYKLNVDPKQLADMKCEINSVASLTYSTDTPIFVDIGKMQVPKNYRFVLPDVTSVYAIASDGGTDTWLDYGSTLLNWNLDLFVQGTPERRVEAA